MVMELGVEKNMIMGSPPNCGNVKWDVYIFFNKLVFLRYHFMMDCKDF